MNIPEWDEILEKTECSQEKIDPLERFILKYEPTALVSAIDKWRKDLQAVVDFVIESQYPNTRFVISYPLDSDYHGYVHGPFPEIEQALKIEGRAELYIFRLVGDIEEKAEYKWNSDFRRWEKV